MTKENRHLRIFLCYAHEDKDDVLKLYQRLKNEGFQPWMDSRDLIPGQNWKTAIRKAVEESDVFIPCITQQSVTKQGFVQREVVFALDVAEEQPEGFIYIIPVRMDESIVPERLHEWHWCNYFESDGYERLVQALELRIEQLDIPPSSPELESVGQSEVKPEPVGLPIADTKRLWSIIGVVSVVFSVLLFGGLLLSRENFGQVLPTPTQKGVVVVSSPTPMPEHTATPTLISTNPLFPVTLNEWRNETAQLSRTLTREGNHYWRYVPSSTYTIGGWRENDDASDIKLSPYWIAKYPITVQQYRQFIKAGGYATQEYWTENGWMWKENENRTQPWMWDDEKYNSDNQPVAGLTWYEATAFAKWLNSELDDILSNDMHVRLPTEAEWEVACAYDGNGQRHTYPWGEQEPTRDLASLHDGDYNDRPASIGKHIAGAASNGAQDMAGTVSEFTSSAYDDTYDTYPASSHDVDMDVVLDMSFDTRTRIVLRGGYGFFDATEFGCSSRINVFHPDLFTYNGFRLVLSF